MFFDHGQWQQANYHRFGVYPCKAAYANLWQGANGIGFNPLVGPMRLKQNHWYTLLPAVYKGSKFLALIWDNEKPDNLIRYREMIGEKWAGLDYRFAGFANKGTQNLDDVDEFKFTALKK